MLPRMRNPSALVLSSLTLLLAACSDPAENTTAARVEATPAEPSEPQPSAANGERESLTIDTARSSVGFTGSKVTDSHDGTFRTFSGTMQLDPNSIENSSVSVTIQIDSVQIEPERLRTHLLSPDLFDAAQFPTATFQSTRIRAGGEGGTHTVTGNLTLHGQTRAITFPATIEVQPNEVRARAEFSINRQDFGIVYPGMPDDLIRDAVVIRFDVRAPRPG
jgi:polyisoprenoid-binding protein YceI